MSGTPPGSPAAGAYAKSPVYGKDSPSADDEVLKRTRSLAGRRRASVAASKARALYLAVGAGRVDEVALLLASEDADPNCVSKDGTSLLQAAASGGHAGVVPLLIAAGALVDEKDAKGWTPLVTATFSGHGECVRALAKAGANLEETDPAGKTALMHAASLGNVPVISALLQGGANPATATSVSWLQ